MVSAKRLVRKFRTKAVVASLIPDKVFGDFKIKMKTALNKPISSPDEIPWKLEEHFIPLHKAFVNTLNDLGIHRHAERFLAERLETRLNIIRTVMDKYRKLTTDLNSFHVYPRKTAEDEILSYIVYQVFEPKFQSKVTTLGDALKAEYVLDTNKVRSLVNRTLKKATPEELEALRRNTLLEGSENDFKIGSRFLDKNLPAKTVGSLLKRVKIEIDFLGWFDSIRRLLEANYTQNEIEGFDQFSIGNLKAIVIDPDTDTVDLSQYARRLVEARSLLRNKGFERLWYGTFMINSKEFKKLTPESQKAYRDLGYTNLDNVAGEYHSGEDVIHITAPPNHKLVTTVIHEMGHRYWYKFMTPEQRGRFNGQVKIKPSEKFRDFKPSEVDDQGEEKKVDPVSNYGGSSIEEAFAEVFTHYVKGEDLNQEQIKSFKSVAKTGGTRKALNLDTPLPEYWFENEKGEVRIPDEKFEFNPPLTEDFKFQFSQNPLYLRTHVMEVFSQRDVDKCPHLNVKKDHGLIKGLEGRICNHCQGR